jgi:hypothetical protein
VRAPSTPRDVPAQLPWADARSLDKVAAGLLKSWGRQGQGRETPAANSWAEAFGRVRPAGVAARSPSGAARLYNRKVVAAFQRGALRFSITAKMPKSLCKAIDKIAEEAWVALLDRWWCRGGRGHYGPLGNEEPRQVVCRLKLTQAASLHSSRPTSTTPL